MGKILENLALLQPGGDLPFLGLITAQENHLARGSTVIMITPSISEGIVLAANELSMRSMHPVVILIDPSTFGGTQGALELEGNLKSQGIPVIRVSNHENLKSVLESSGKPADIASVRWWNGILGEN
jgi:hypothetical protein